MKKVRHITWFYELIIAVRREGNGNYTYVRYSPFTTVKQVIDEWQDVAKAIIVTMQYAIGSKLPFPKAWSRNLMELPGWTVFEPPMPSVEEFKRRRNVIEEALDLLKCENTDQKLVVFMLNHFKKFGKPKREYAPMFYRKKYNR